MKITTRTTALLLIYICLHAGIVSGSTLLPYDENIARTTPVYTIYNNNFEVLRDKNITVNGRVMHVYSSGSHTYPDGTSLVIDSFNFYSIGSEEYGNNFIKITIPSDLSTVFKKSLGSKVILRGTASSATLSEERFNGQRLPNIEYEHCKIWLE